MKTQEIGQSIIIFYRAYLFNFLFDSLNYTTHQAQSNDRIRASFLKTVEKWQFAKDGHNSPWKLKKKVNLSIFCIEHIFSISYSIFWNLIWQLYYSPSPIQWLNPCVYPQNRSEMAIIHHENSRKSPIYHYFV